MSSAALTSTATIATVEPARIILRLCKHWGHKFDVAYDDVHGLVDVPATPGLYPPAQHEPLSSP